MNIYRNLTTAALTFLGRTSAYKFIKPLVPVQIMRGCQNEDMLLGLIHSKIDYVEPPLGLKRELLDAQLFCMAEIGSIDRKKPSPVFARQNEIIHNSERVGGIFIGRNEELIKSAFRGEQLSFDTIFDVINVQNTFDTFNTIHSYDLNKMSGDMIHHRLGYTNEFFEKDGIRHSLYQIPILSDGKKVLGSQFCDFNQAAVDADTKDMLTVVFSFGKSVDSINTFADQLTYLRKDLEEHATHTAQMQIVSGYPAVYQLGCVQDPIITCQVK